MKFVIVFLLTTIVLSVYSQNNSKEQKMESLYFENPIKSVEVISELISKSDWETLTKYYNLSKTDIDKNKLLSGDFFIKHDEPDVSHPGGFWRYKHPFAPGFKYFYDEMLEDNIVKVSLQIEIDQGGRMIQHGTDTFYLKKSDKGYQLLPGD